MSKVVLLLFSLISAFAYAQSPPVIPQVESLLAPMQLDSLLANQPEYNEYKELLNRLRWDRSRSATFRVAGAWSPVHAFKDKGTYWISVNFQSVLSPVVTLSFPDSQRLPGWVVGKIRSLAEQANTFARLNNYEEIRLSGPKMTTYPNLPPDVNAAVVYQGLPLEKRFDFSCRSQSYQTQMEFIRLLLDADLSREVNPTTCAQALRQRFFGPRLYKSRP